MRIFIVGSYDISSILKPHKGINLYFVNKNVLVALIKLARVVLLIVTRPVSPILCYRSVNSEKFGVTALGFLEGSQRSL